MIINKTKNDRSVIREATKTVGKSAYKYCTVLTIILLIIVAVDFIMADLKAFAIFAFIAFAGAIFIWELAIRKIKASENRAMYQIEEIYGEDFYESTITFAENEITIETKTTTKVFEKSEIEKYIETENLFIIFYSGKSYLSVSKKGFVEGSASELRKYLEACR